MKKVEQKEVNSICNNCNKLSDFSFNGCTISCNKFKNHIVDILKINCSPCQDLRCKIPGANNKKIGICIKCRLPAIYADRQGKMDIKSVLGMKQPTQYVTEWDINHGYKSK